jgi:hypothetical protein
MGGDMGFEKRPPTIKRLTNPRFIGQVIFIPALKRRGGTEIGLAIEFF